MTKKALLLSFSQAYIAHSNWRHCFRSHSHSSEEIARVSQPDSVGELCSATRVYSRPLDHEGSYAEKTEQSEWFVGESSAMVGYVLLHLFRRSSRCYHAEQQGDSDSFETVTIESCPEWNGYWIFVCRPSIRRPSVWPSDRSIFMQLFRDMDSWRIQFMKLIDYTAYQNQ